MITYEEALARRRQVQQDFNALMDKGRKVGITTDELAENLKAYRLACDAVWEAMFANIVDTGVKVFTK